MGVPGGANNANEGLNFWGVPKNPFTGPALGPRADNFANGRNFFGVPFSQIAMLPSNSVDDMVKFAAPIGVGLGAGSAVAAGIGMGARAAGAGGGGTPPVGTSPSADVLAGNNTDASGIGGLLGGGLQLAGTNQALLAYQEAQRRAQEAGNFTPYNVFSGLGSSTMGPNGLTSQLSPQYQDLRNQYLGNAAAGAGAAGSFDPNQMANQVYGQMQAQAAPGEAEQRANAIAQLQGMGQIGLGVGADTGAGPANPLYSSLLKSQADAARQRQLSSYGMSQDIANQMQQRALGWGGAGLGLDQSQLQQQQLGLYGGGLQSNAALRGAQLAQNPLLMQGLTRGGVLSGMGTGLMSGAGGIPAYLRQQFPNLFGPATGPTGVDQYGNPTQGNFQSGGVGGDTSGFNNYTGQWDSGMSQFNPSVDWSNLYG